MNPEYITELENVSKTFWLADKQPIEVLSQINLGIKPGEFIALLGQSGSGKSTLLRILAGLIPPTSGVVYERAKKLSGINKSLAIVFQSFALYPWLTVYENVRIGLNKRQLAPEEERQEIDNALTLIGLSGHDNAYPKELSGGMRQRVGFARALVARPPILAMDEPFSALDVLTARNLRAEIIDFWVEKKNAFQSAFMVTHNISEAVSMASKIIILSSNPGRLAHVILNNLPYPRNEKSSAFLGMVDEIHDLITALNLPDVATRERSTRAAPARVENLPPVEVNRLFGFLEAVVSDGGRVDIFALTQQMREEFGSVIAVAKALEILELVVTPEHEVVITPLGREMIDADPERRKEIFRHQIQRLALFRLLKDKLTESETVTEDDFKREIHAQFPYENADKMIDTIVDWGRYAEIFDFDANLKVFTRQRDAQV